MRIKCPLCGDRDRREFYYMGSADLMARPDADAEAFHQYLHIRENPAGPNAELWSHAMGCRAWLKVVRNTATHEVLSVDLAAEAGREGA